MAIFFFSLFKPIAVAAVVRILNKPPPRLSSSRASPLSHADCLRGIADSYRSTHALSEQVELVVRKRF